MAQVLSAGMVLRTLLVCKDGAQESLTQLMYTVQLGTTPTATDADVATQVDQDFGAGLPSFLNNNASYDGTLAQIIWPLPVLVRQVSTVHAGTGSGGATAMPKQVSGLISWYTAKAKQANRGRSYIPFPSTTFDTGDGVPTAAYVTLLNAFAATYVTPLTVSVSGRTATLLPIVYHRVTHTWDVILNSIQRPAWATQRRRGAFGRPNIPPV